MNIQSIVKYSFSIFALAACLQAFAHDHGGGGYGGGRANYQHYDNHRDGYYNNNRWNNNTNVRVYSSDAWYHPDHVYYYDGYAYPNYYNGSPYYYYDPRWYYDGAPGLNLNINIP